jgi:hypothetical protein
MGRGVFGVEAISWEDLFGGQEQSVRRKTLPLREGGIKGFAEGDNFVDKLNVWRRIG